MSLDTPRSAPPPQPIQHRTLRPVDYEVVLHQQRTRNEKARQHMARKRAELKMKPKEIQEQAAERSRLYRARYRERHRKAVLLAEAQRRGRIYIERYGQAAFDEYLERRQRQECSLFPAKLQPFDCTCNSRYKSPRYGSLDVQ
ncbi:hypothetical protein C8F01DRAFT_1369086 [Mycena amicta]|nr:hypothetical protein C8F01DRAFT_1369086 [Mycena amicta]